jgi:predicted GH43/DUF377 family glycosyl hydrolase
MSHSAALWIRYVIILLMSVPALGASGCNCRGRGGDSDDAQGVPSSGILQFSTAGITVSEYVGTVTVQVNRTGGSLGAVSVNYATTGGTATAGTDYTATNGTLNWADGNTTPQTFPITITDDLLADNNETIVVSLSAPTGGAGTGGDLTITLVDVWTKFPGNPVLGPTSGSWDDLAVLAPSVHKEGATYVMYYQAGGAATPDSIGRATSPDGIAWTKTGTAPVFGPAPGGGTTVQGAFDDDVLLRPCVVHDPAATPPYRMWYTGIDLFNDTMGNAVFTVAIGMATSTDGLAWTRANSGNPVLINGATGTWDEFGVAFSCVINDGGTFKMWYMGFNATTSAIGYATSSDGIAWAKNTNPVFSPTGAAFEAGGLSDPWVIKDGSFYRMFYTGVDSGGTTFQIGYARSSDGITGWTPFAGNPVISPSASGFDSTDTFYPCLLRDGNTFPVWFTGTSGNGSTGRDGLATNP